MARQETIQILIDKSRANVPLQELKKEADALKKAFGSIKVGDSVKAIREQATAAREVARAAQEAAKAEEAKARATAASAKAKADAIAAEERGNREVLATLEKESKALQENEKYRQKAAKTEQEAAKVKQQTARAEQEAARASQERAKAEQQSAKAQQERLKIDEQAAKTLTAESKMNEQAAKSAENRAQREKKAASDTEKAYQQIVKAQDQAFSNRADTAIQQQINGLLGIGQAAKSAEESMRVFQRSGYFDQLAQQAKSAETAQSKMNATMREAEHAAKRQENALKKLGTGIGQVNANQATSIQYMTQWIRQQDGLNNATVQATGAVHNAAGSFQTYRASVQEAGGATHNYRMAVDTATGEVYQLDQGIRTTSVSLRDMSSILRSLRTVIGFTGVAQSLRYAFGEMKNMSDAMAEYRKVTGATAQEMENLRGQAYEIAKAYGQSASDVISSAANMARAGYRENSVAMAELATRTKLVGDMTQEAADKFLIAVDAAYKYGGNVEKLSAILDAANQIDNNFATTIEKVSDGMTLVASLASTAHVPVEQLMAALGTMTAVTQRSGSETARGLRSVILNVIGDTTTEIEEGVTATEDSVKTMSEALNLYAKDVVEAAQKTGQLINPMEAIVALQKAWKQNKITEADLNAISNDVAGKRYFNVFTALITNPEMYNAMLQEISDSVGSAQNEIDILMQSWSNRLENLKTTWVQIVNRSITEGFIKDLIDGASAALEFTGSLENLAIAASGALFAFRSLSAGIGNLRAGAVFGGFNAFTSLLGLAVTGIGVWKASYENNIRQMQQAAAEAVSNAVNQSNQSRTLAGIQKRYSEIAGDGIQEEQGEIEELKTLQSELNGLVGEQAKAIDLVNGKYGTTIKALKEMTEQQRKNAMTDLIAARSKAVASFAQSDLNEFIGWGQDTGVLLPMLKNKDSEWFKHYIQLNSEFFSIGAASLFQGGLTGGQRLNISKPTDAEGIVRLLEEADALYKLFGSRTTSGQEVTKGLQSMGEEYSGTYEALGKFVSRLHEAGDSVVDVQNAISDFNKELETLQESAENGGESINTAAESALTLAGAIESATAAKTAFDDAMKTSKADALNGYITAFETLKKEMEAGRVNSTAFYAAARMLLGEEAYNATGGTSEGALAALNRKGGSGSAYDAWNILTQKYYDEQGKEIEGYGVYQLLKQTTGFTGNLLTAEGKAAIPELTSADLALISRSWGGIDPTFILSVLEAFDQYDKSGAEARKQATEGQQKTEEQTAATAEQTEAAQAAAEGQKELAEAEKEQAEAAEQLSEEVDAITGADKPSATEGEEGAPAVVTPDITQAKKDAEEWKALLDEVEAAYIRINEAKVGPSPELEALISDIEKIREEIEINVKAGAGTGTSALVAATIAAAISAIEGYAKDGTISITTAATLTGNLKDGLISIINNAKTAKELDAIEIAVSGDVTPLDADINEAIAAKREEISVDVTADTKEADDKIAETEKGPYSATVNVGETGSDKVEQTLKELTKTRYVKVVEQYVKDDGTSKEKWVTDDGSTKTGEQGRFATGTRSHPGGLSLVNDGDGPELIVDRGRAFIAGDGRPALVNLQKGAKVFTAMETRQIFNGSGVPAYAAGTPNDIFGGGGNGPYSIVNSGVNSSVSANAQPKDESGEGGSGSKKSGGGGSNYKFDDLKTMIDYIIERIGRGLNEQIEILDKQIETLKLERERKEREDELEKLRKNLSDAENNRIVRYIDENGQWHWMADQKNVQKAREALTDYEEEAAFNAQIEAIQAQKTALQEEYSKITKAWSDIQYGMSTPTGDLNAILQGLLKSGDAKTKKGAETVETLLISQLLQGGIYSGNYDEALEAIAKASAGNPIMPGESSATLASLIASAESMGTGTETANALMAADIGRTMTNGLAGAAGTGTMISYNYFINGVQIGSEQANQPLSSILRTLAVQAGAEVA